MEILVINVFEILAKYRFLNAKQLTNTGNFSQYEIESSLNLNYDLKVAKFLKLYEIN